MEDLRSTWFQEVMSDHHLHNLPSGHGTSYHLGVEGTTTLQVYRLNKKEYIVDLLLQFLT